MRLPKINQVSCLLDDPVKPGPQGRCQLEAITNGFRFDPENGGLRVAASRNEVENRMKVQLVKRSLSPALLHGLTGKEVNGPGWVARLHGVDDQHFVRPFEKVKRIEQGRTHLCNHNP